MEPPANPGRFTPLSREFRVLRVDTRGHGRSSVPAGSYTLDQLGRDLVGLLDHLEIDAVRYCGLSMGGLVGMWLGLHAPSRLSHLMLANTAAKIGSAALWDGRIESVKTSGVRAISDAVLARWLTPQFAETYPAEVVLLRHMFERTPALGYAGCCAAIRDTDLRNRVSEILVPSCVIVGSHDAATTPSEGHELARSIAGCRVLELDSAHLSNVEAAELFNAAVRAFL